MRGSLPPLPQTPSWRDVELNKPQGQLYFAYMFHNARLRRYTSATVALTIKFRTG